MSNKLTNNKHNVITKTSFCLSLLLFVLTLFSAINTFSATMVYAQDTENSEDLISDELKKEKAEAEARSAIAVAKQQIAEAEKAIAEAQRSSLIANFPESDITPLDGSIKATNLEFESNALAHVALRSVAKELYTKLKDHRSKYQLQKLKIFIENESTPINDNLNDFSMYKEKRDELIKKFGEQGIKDQTEEEIKNGIDKGTESSLEKFSLDSFGSGFTVSTAVLDSVIGVISRFRVNREYQGTETDVGKESLIAMLRAESLKDDDKFTLFITPELNYLDLESNNIIAKEISDLAMLQAVAILKIKDEKQKLSQLEEKIKILENKIVLVDKTSYVTLPQGQQSKYDAISKEILELKEEMSKINNGEEGYDNIKELSSLIDKTQNLVENSLENSSSIILGYKFEKLLKENQNTIDENNNSVHSLYLNIKSGGSNQTNQSLFSNSIKFSGGIIATYSLNMISPTRDDIHVADTLCFYTDYVKIDSEDISAINICK